MTPKRALIALALALAAPLAWALGPAFSAQTYLPGGIDFEQELDGVKRVAPQPRSARPRAGHPGEGAVSFRSAPVEAPKRFDLVGLAGEIRPIEFRAREDSGAWSDWVEVAHGDPVYFGGAERLQLRTRGWRPSGTLHYVNVSGDSTPLEGVLSAARGVVNDAVVAAVGIAAGDAAEAAPSKPATVSRAEWGANLSSSRGCPPRTEPAYGDVRAAAVHHTVTSNSYSRAEAPSIVLGICRYHRNANRWNDIGYNALVDRFGTLYQGRAGGLARPVVGAHSQGFNSQTFGLASIGTHTSAPISRAAKRGAAKLLAWKLVVSGHEADGRARLVSAGGSASRYEEGRVVKTKRIEGHRRFGLTECPGDALKRQLPDLRERTQRLIDASGGGGDGGGSGGVGSH